MSGEELVTGFTQIFGFKMQLTFSRTFFKTIISFSRNKVIKQVFNSDPKTQEQSFFRGTLQTYGRGWIRFEKKIHL